MIIDQKKIFLAAQLLKEGNVVAFPTETVYGLGARVFDERAIQKIYTLKGRPSDNPLIVHIGNMEEIFTLAKEVPETALLLQKKFFPGPLTLVLKRNPNIPALVSAGLSTIAIRMPSHPIALKLLQTLGEPIAAPSANLSGRPSPTRAEHVFEDFQDKLGAILDGGPCEWGIESTVLSLVHPEPILLRPGTIQREALEEAIGKKIALAKPNEKVLSPGMKYRHYAPRGKIHFFEEEDELFSYLNKSPHLIRMVLSRKVVDHSLWRKLSQKDLYDSLREADQKKVEEILVLCDPITRKDVAIMNRLTLAAGHEK